MQAAASSALDGFPGLDAGSERVSERGRGAAGREGLKGTIYDPRRDIPMKGADIAFKKQLVVGIALKKHGRRKQYMGLNKRTFWLSEDDCLHWQKGRKDPQKSKDFIRLLDVTDIVVGMSTDVLKKNGRPKMIDRYLSLVTAERTVDIETDTMAQVRGGVERAMLGG
jgi:hypothetical protein